MYDFVSKKWSDDPELTMTCVETETTGAEINQTDSPTEIESLLMDIEEWDVESSALMSRLASEDNSVVVGLSMLSAFLLLLLIAILATKAYRARRNKSTGSQETVEIK